MRRHGMLTGLVSMLAALGAACAPTEPAEEATAANAPVEATARFMLVERQGALWRGYLVDTVLPEKAPQLMLLPGRELVVSVRPK